MKTGMTNAAEISCGPEAAVLKTVMPVWDSSIDRLGLFSTRTEKEILNQKISAENAFRKI